MHPWYGPAHRDAPVDDRRARVDEPQTEITRYGSTATRKEVATLGQARRFKRYTRIAGQPPVGVDVARRPPPATSFGRADERRELSIGSRRGGWCPAGSWGPRREAVAYGRGGRGGRRGTRGRVAKCGLPAQPQKSPADGHRRHSGPRPWRPTRRAEAAPADTHTTPTNAADASTCANPTITACPSVDSQWSRMMVTPHIGQAGGGALWAGAD